jgi:hypothetical protein
MKKPKTKKQRIFFNEVLQASSYTDAARKAGYSEASARVSAHRNITKYNDFFVSIFQEAGLDIKALAKNIKQGLKSKNEQVRFKYTKLSLDLVGRTLDRLDEMPLEPQEINQADVTKQATSQLNLAIRLQKYRGNDEVVFIKKSDLPSGIDSLSAQELITHLRLDEEAQVASTDRVQTDISFSKEGNLRMGIYE